jgi:hypothetical protein
MVQPPVKALVGTALDLNAQQTMLPIVDGQRDCGWPDRRSDLPYTAGFAWVVPACRGVSHSLDPNAKTPTGGALRPTASDPLATIRRSEAHVGNAAMD